MNVYSDLKLVNHFSKLPHDYYSEVLTEPLSAPRWVHFNQQLAGEIGLPEAADQPELLAVLSGNSALPGGHCLASVYAGHQFGVYVPQLGDGRAMLLGQAQNSAGELFELQLKGAGRTPYSRSADGRAVLRSSIREYLCSEAMHALGVPTTRALSLVASPDPVQRESIESAAVVCRVAPSFIRFGHFEFFYYLQRFEQLAPLADHVIDLHFPHLNEFDNRYAAWLSEVVDRTADLVAHWQSIGFCHGVMNTDNFSILGQTIDYGPFGFLDGFSSGHICNHSDEAGRYAYEQQPRVAFWNCSKLLQATLPLLDSVPEKAVEIAQGILGRFAERYSGQIIQRWNGKLGLIEVEEGDRDLANGFLNILDRGKNDFTRCFRALASIEQAPNAPPPAVRDEVTDVAAFDAWLEQYRARLRGQAEEDSQRTQRMNQANPKYILRNHLLQTAIERSQDGDDSEVARLFNVLSKPFDEQPESEQYAAPAPDWAQSLSVSCSS